jgi:hypothetical protein
MLRETKKCKYGSQVIPAYVLDHSVSPLARSYTLEERSESWFNVMLHAYKEDIAYLGNQLENARFGGDSENKLREVYESAMTLSYVTDCTELADLRLRCLMEIGLRPNSHSDIEQILHVIPADHFERNPSSLYLIEKCLAMYSEPLSKWSVSCIMYDLKHFVLYSSEREVVKKCLKHCSGGKVRWFKSAYSYMLQGDEAAWSWLENCIESLIKEDRVFEMQYNAAA